MISQTLENKLKASLAEAIDAWMANNQGLIDELDMWFGESLHEHMANAAFNVLAAQKDVQFYLKQQGLIE